MCLCPQFCSGVRASMWDCGGVCGSACVRVSRCALLRVSVYVFVACVVARVCACERVFVRAHTWEGLPHSFCMGPALSKPNLREIAHWQGVWPHFSFICECYCICYSNMSVFRHLSSHRYPDLGREAFKMRVRDPAGKGINVRSTN